MFKYLLFATLVASALGISIPYDLCPAPGGEGTLPGPVSFAIPECDTFPCGVKIGQAVTLLIGIHVDDGVDALPTDALITVGGHTFPFELPNGDACYAIATGCPEKSGYYMIEFPTSLRGVDPGTTATVTVQINDHNRNVIACGSVTTTFQ